MKRTIVLLRRFAVAGLVPSILSVCFVAGCSGGGVAEGTVAASHGMTRAEFVAFKKAKMSRKDLDKARTKKTIVEMKEQGEVVEIVPAGKRPRPPR